MAKTVEAVFYSTLSKTVSTVDVKVPTGGRGHAMAVRLACNDYAHKNEYTHWAQEVQETEDGRNPMWVVYRSTGLARSVSLQFFPTKEAAEMWLVHCG